MSGGLDTGFDESIEARKFRSIVMIGTSIDMERAIECLTDAARCAGVSSKDLWESLISLVERDEHG